MTCLPELFLVINKYKFLCEAIGLGCSNKITDDMTFVYEFVTIFYGMFVPIWREEFSNLIYYCGVLI